MDAIGRHPTWQIGQYHWFEEKTQVLILPVIRIQPGIKPPLTGFARGCDIAPDGMRA